MRVIVVGSLNVDLVVDVERLPAPGETVLGGGLRRHAGGKGLNQAIAAARQGAEVVVVGCLGDDDGGRWLRALLEAEGIDGSHVAVVASAATGTALITVDAAGAAQITVAPGANATVTPGDVEAALADLAVGAGDVVLVQLEIPLAAAVAAIRAAGEATTILNPAPAVPLDDALRSADVLVPNEHELTTTGLGRHHTVVTLGAAGARWHPDAATTTDVPPFAVDAVDSTGAGDAFCGALAAALTDGAPIPDALRRAAAAGALAVTRPGAAEAMPSAAEVDELLRQRP